jgi:hypothetical protein
MKALGAIDAATLNGAAADQLKWMLGDDGKAALESLSGSGLALDESIRGGLLLTDKKPKLGDGGLPWCCIEVSMKGEQSTPTSALPSVAQPTDSADGSRQLATKADGGEATEPVEHDSAASRTPATAKPAESNSDLNRQEK